MTSELISGVCGNVTEIVFHRVLGNADFVATNVRYPDTQVSKVNTVKWASCSGEVSPSIR